MILTSAESIKNEARKAINDALKTAGGRIAQESQKMVPRVTGKLARSIHTNLSGLSLEVGYSADYAKAAHDTGDTRFLTEPFSRLAPECEGLILHGIEEALK